jgi:hypothetical protein
LAPPELKSSNYDLLPHSFQSLKAIAVTTHPYVAGIAGLISSSVFYGKPHVKPASSDAK